MKKVLLACLTVCAFLLVGCANSASKNKTAEDYLDEMQITTKIGTSDCPLNDAQKFVLNMGLGWNLGNTLDAYSSKLSDLSTETCWGLPVTTKSMIDGLASSGIKTIRIPVSWHNHFVDDAYTIDIAWMNRVKEIVDWAFENDMYVILNIHHDDAFYSAKPVKYNEGFIPLRKDQAESEKFLSAVWRQVGITFKDYSEKLIFETMNEPRLRDNVHEWSFNNNCSACLEAEQVLLEYNQLCIDTIRATGGNNSTIRYISCPNLMAGLNTTFRILNSEVPDAKDYKTQIELLKDTVPNHLIQSVHMYTPWDFTGDYSGSAEFDENTYDELTYWFNYLTYFIKKGYPVIIGETGAVNKGNLDARAKWYACFTGFAKGISATLCIWDNGNSNVGDDSFGFYNRTKQTWYFPLLKDIALKQTERVTETVQSNLGQ